MSGRAAFLLLFLSVCVNQFHAVRSDTQLDARLAACKKVGWVFLPDVQQQSWDSIINCDASREPWAACDSNPQCVGFTSNGDVGNGWLYRLPHAKQCRPLDNLANLQWQWAWKWVPMKCKDRGPCCGTYIANDAGPNAAFTLRCQDNAHSHTTSTRQCPCPRLYSTHHYSSIKEFDVDCEAHKKLPKNAERQAPHTAAASSTRALRASQPGHGLARLYLAEVTKVPTGAPRTNALVSQVATGACIAAARTCGNIV